METALGLRGRFFPESFSAVDFASGIELDRSRPAAPRLRRRLEAYFRSLGHGDPSVSEATRLLFRCHHAALDIRSDIARDHGLTPGHLISLLLLRACYPDESVTPTELREAQMLSSGGTTKVVRGLEERGLVTRRDHRSDARSSVLVLTEAGLELIDAVVPLIQERGREVLMSSFDADELAELIRLLGKIRRTGGAEGRLGAEAESTLDEISPRAPRHRPGVWTKVQFSNDDRGRFS